MNYLRVWVLIENGYGIEFDIIYDHIDFEMRDFESYYYRLLGYNAILYSYLSDCFCRSFVNGIFVL